MMRSLSALCLLTACVAAADAAPVPITTGANTQALTLGKTVTLSPTGTAAGDEVKLRLDGYGDEKTEEGKTLSYVDVTLEVGGERQRMRFWLHRSGDPRRWRGYEVRMTETEDRGPPHSANARSTFVVVKRQQEKPG